MLHSFAIWCTSNRTIWGERPRPKRFVKKRALESADVLRTCTHSCNAVNVTGMQTSTILSLFPFPMMWTKPCSKSTSQFRSPHSSPIRIPVPNSSSNTALLRTASLWLWVEPFPDCTFSFRSANIRPVSALVITTGNLLGSFSLIRTRLTGLSKSSNTHSI